jgi:hypothetical protein
MDSIFGVLVIFAIWIAAVWGLSKLADAIWPRNDKH